MTLKIAKGEIPSTTRDTEPNPFTDLFPSDDESLIVVMPGKEEDKTDDGKAIRKVCKQARDAANAVDRTARVKHDYDAKTKKSTLTIWTIGRITRSNGKDDGSKGE